VRDCGDARGFGLFACRNFKAGALIGEYVGEVMRARNYAQLRRERKEKHWYFMALDKEEVVDASRRGGLTRFLNHSCEPNAECQSWTVDGEKRIAIVAQRPIAADEEVTFDYSWKGAVPCLPFVSTAYGWRPTPSPRA
jgi:SET domain-containing protein